MKEVRNPERARRLHEDAPEALRVFAVVGGVDMVLAEADRVGNLVGELIDADLDAKLREDAHELGIEVGH